MSKTNENKKGTLKYLFIEDGQNRNSSSVNYGKWQIYNICIKYKKQLKAMTLDMAKDQYF